MVPLMQELAKVYQVKQPGDAVAVVPGSLNSTGGIRATDTTASASCRSSSPFTATCR